MKNKNFKMIYWFDKLCNSKAMKKFTTVWLITLLTMGQAFAGNSSFYTSNRSEEKNEISDVQQTKSVKGRVTDASGETIPGVTISVKGTNQGTTTNIDGEYQLINVQENAVLVFSFVGMETEEIPVAGKTIINVVMSESSIALQEVVAIGYGTMKKSDLTGLYLRYLRVTLSMASSSSTPSLQQRLRESPSEK